MPADPQWGKKNNEGPPDLDEILRKLQQKIAALLGFGGRPARPVRRRNVGTAVGGGVAFVFSSSSPCGSRAVLTSSTKVAAASCFAWARSSRPRCRARAGTSVSHRGVEVVNVSQVNRGVGYRGNPKNKQPQEALMLTDDENIVDIQFAVQYTLKTRGLPLQQPQPRRQRAAGGGDRGPRGRRQEQDGLRLSPGRSEVSARVKVLMQQILDRYKTGINITTVNLQGASAPEQVQPSFEDVVRAQQDRERFKNEGQAYANDVVPKARGVSRAPHRGGQRLPPERDQHRPGRSRRASARSSPNTRRRRR
jgi:membrane protease subunit HflK